jgi:hypothetical protein
LVDYDSNKQLKIEGFETPFYNSLNKNNRWVKLAAQIPWDELVSIYMKKMSHKMGRKSLSPRLVIGAMIIKHKEALSDRAVVENITENVYMQYFCGFESMIDQPPFDASMFVHFRKRLGEKEFDSFSQLVVNKATGMSTSSDKKPKQPSDGGNTKGGSEPKTADEAKSHTSDATHQGILKIDATVISQDITYPTDLKLLNASRLKAEEIIDYLFVTGCFTTKKPRTYRDIAKKAYLSVAKKRRKGVKTVRKAIKQQLQYLRRDIEIIHNILDKKPYLLSTLSRQQYKYLLVIQELYRQQNEMYKEKKRSITHRIVSIHQPHVRPILRGKDKARTEFGAKVNASTINGFTFIDQIQWENYNESTFLQDQVAQYQKRFKCLPKYILADKIYLNRANRAFMKTLGIMITGKPLGRPPKKSKKLTKEQKEIHNQRNHIEGKFGQLKRARHLNINKAKLAATSFSWIAASVFITNLLTLAKSHFILFMLLLKCATTQAKRELITLVSRLSPKHQLEALLVINTENKLIKIQS